MASDGDIRVPLAMDLAGIAAFTWGRVTAGALFLAAVTYVVVLR